MNDKNKITPPDFSEEEMIMPTNFTHQPISATEAKVQKESQQNTTVATTKTKKGGGVLLTILALVLFLLLAAGAYWYLSTQTNILNNHFFVSEEEARGVVPLPTNLSNENDGLDVYSEEGDIDSINRDIENTNLQRIIRDSEGIEFELNAALESNSTLPPQPAPVTNNPEIPEEMMTDVEMQ